MSNCDDSFKQIQDLQEQNRQLQEQLAEAERLRKAAGVFTRADMGETFIFLGRDGVPKELGKAELQRGFQQLAGRMSSKEVDEMVKRGLDEKAKPFGADGRFINYDQILRQVDIAQVEDYSKLLEALGVTLERQAPDDFAFITETYGKERILDIASQAYADLGVPTDVLRARMLTDSARFIGLVESKVRMRFLADRYTHILLERMGSTSQYMRDLPGAPVKDGMKADLLRDYRMALLSHRANVHANRRTAQALRSQQDDLSDLTMRLDLDDDQEGLADALGVTARDIGKDEMFGRIMQSLDDGPKGQLQLDEIIQAIKIGGVDPKSTLDKDWYNTHMRLGNALAKDSQLSNLNTQVKANLMSNVGMAFFGPIQETLINGIRLTPVGTRMSRGAFMDSIRITSKALTYAKDYTRATLKADVLRAFWEGGGMYAGNADTYGRRLLTNEQEIAEIGAILDAPFQKSGNWALTTANPQNMGLLRNKLQVAARILAFSKPMDPAGMNRLEAAWRAMGIGGSGKAEMPVPDTFLPWKPGLRLMGAVDEGFGKFQYLFKLKADLEMKARTEGAQLGLLDQRTRDEWVQARLDEAIYQATPSEANIKSFRKQHSLKGSDFTDDEIGKMIAEQNMAGGPTLATPESRTAFDYSAWARFQNRPQSSEMGSWLGKPIEKLDEAMMSARQAWGVDMVFPYWRSPFNALLMDQRLATFAAVDTAKMIFGNPTQLQVAKTKAAWIMSGTTLAMFGMLEAGGHIDGGMGADPSKRNRIFGTPYLGGLPVLNTLFLWKDLKDAAMNANDSGFDKDEVLTGVMQVLTNQLLRSTGLTTIHQLLEALNGDRSAWQSIVRYVGFLGAGQLPFIGPVRNIERFTGTDGASFFRDGNATPGERYWLDQDSPLAGVERALRDLAYNTLPSIAAATGSPRKTRDHLGNPIGNVNGIDIAKWFPFFPSIWPKGRIHDVVYGELDTQDLLDPPEPLLTKTLNGIGMSDELQNEYNDIHGSVKGDSFLGRMALAGKTVAVRFPMPTEVVTSGGVRIRKDGGATIPIGQFLEKHVKGKTKLQAFYSLFEDPIYQAMEDDPLQSADPRIQDQPKALRRTRPAQLLITAVTSYYDLLTQDELERRAAAGTSEPAKQWSAAKTRMAEEQFKRGQETLDPSRPGNWVQKLVDSVR
jgi:hypothetical protein